MCLLTQTAVRQRGLVAPAGERDQRNRNMERDYLVGFTHAGKELPNSVRVQS